MVNVLRCMLQEREVYLCADCRGEFIASADRCKIYVKVGSNPNFSMQPISQGLE